MTGTKLRRLYHTKSEVPEEYTTKETDILKRQEQKN